MKAKMKSKHIPQALPKGKPIHTSYLNDKFELTDASKATVVKLRYKDGTVVFGYVNEQ